MLQKGRWRMDGVHARLYQLLGFLHSGEFTISSTMFSVIEKFISIMAAHGKNVALL